ncbi:MAG: energy transducer TonB, partial [Arenicellales bacterium]|nr:energy transducer TonB [Arenicellales bacterium]
MHSLRLLTFLAVSMVGHAAILVPLSDHLFALFDSEQIQSDTVIVSIRVIDHAGAPAEEKAKISEPTQPLHQTVQPNYTKQRKTNQPNTLVQALLEEPASAVPEQPALVAAEPVSLEKQATETTPERTSEMEQQQTHQASQREQSEELKARRHRQLRAEERYLAELLNAIARHRFYPKNARKKGHQGDVEIELTILKNGEFESVKISKAS